jgi:Ca2+-binding EF-hand superfamily protein
MTGIFGPDEIKNVFQLMDLRNSGFITRDQCKEALRSLASSEFQFKNIEEGGKNIPDKVDFEEFKKHW